MRKLLYAISVLALAIIAIGFAVVQAQAVETFTDAKAIQVNTTVTGNVTGDDGEEKDFYRFNLQNDGVVRIRIETPQQSDSEEYWEVNLYDSAYKEMASATVYGNVTVTEMPATGLAAGTYYAEVESPWYYDLSTDTYALTVGFEESSTWEKELNESPDTATNVSLNTTYFGTTHADNGDEKDYYRFDLPSDGSTTVKLETPQQTNNDEYWDLYLYDSSYKEMTSVKVYGNNKVTELPTMGLPTGAYYVMVESPWYGTLSTSTYALTVSFEESGIWEKEFDDAPTAATAIGLNTKYYGTSCNDDDEDYYRFELSEAGAASIQIETPQQANTENYWKAYLYDSSYDEIASIDISGNSTVTTLPTMGLPVGTYYVKVESVYWSWSTDVYALTVSFEESDEWEKELNEAPTSATAIGLNTKYSGTSRNDDDKDYYRFTIPATGTYAIGVTTPNLEDDSSYWVLRLYDATYNQISYVYVNGNRTYHAIKAKLGRGAYYVNVEAYGWRWSSSAYKLKVRPYSSLRPKATRILGKVKAKPKGFKVKWAKVSGVTGYQVQYARNKKFKKSTKVSVSKSKTSLTVKRLLKKKNYRVRVRTYQTYSINGQDVTIYSAWSKAKSVKTKK